MSLWEVFLYAEESRKKTKELGKMIMTHAATILCSFLPRFDPKREQIFRDLVGD